MIAGLLGGAFDPPHSGHVLLAEAAKRHFELEPLRVLVVADPPHKQVSNPVDVASLSPGSRSPTRTSSATSTRIPSTPFRATETTRFSSSAP